LAAAPATAQTIKSLGFNTTNGFVTYSGSNSLTFTNALQFSTNARATTRTNLGLGGSDSVTFSNLSLSSNGSLAIGGMNITAITSGIDLAFKRAGSTELELKTNGLVLHSGSYSFSGGNSNGASTTRTNLGLGATWLTNTNVTNFRTAIGLGTTNNPIFSAITLTEGDELQINGSGIYSVGFGTQIEFETQTLDQDGFRVFAWATNSFAVTPPATFSTNVSIAGSLTVGSFTTTTPSTWALDATQTAAATNGRLTLPSNANVIRLTNNNAISSVTNGVLGAFYYLVNQATNAVTISNVGGITIDGAQNLTLSPNESATVVATGATNVSVANRGDLTDVALGGTANTAPSQTASSGSSLMTRELSDARYMGLKSHSINFAMMATKTASGGQSSSSRGSWQLFTATNANSFASAWGAWGYLLGLDGTQQYISFTNPLTISFSRTAATATLPRTGLFQYVQLGRDVTTISATNTKLAQKGLGVQFASNGLTPFVHNGTSLTDGALITNISNYNRFVLRWVPATAFEVYGVANGSEPVLLGSVTSNLPSGIGVTDSALEFMQLDSGSGGANAWFFLNTAYITTP